MNESDRNLPGQPRPKRIRDVRRHLSLYGIRPTRYELWRMTWEWASKIGHSYWEFHWPSSTEIATQYVFLLLTQMKENRALKLPYRAGDHVPDAIRALVGNQPLLLPNPENP